MAEFSTTDCTLALNQSSTPRVTSTPKNRATISAGATAASENRVTKRRCSRAPASRAPAPSSRDTRQASQAATARLSARATMRQARTSGLPGPSGPVMRGIDPSAAAAAVRAADRA